ncbi:hypothetical protein AAHE18_12G122300 [Arachis hypogaea]|nr:uncharacterized protein DS421_12g370700 [Arachis hypogaea]
MKGSLVITSSKRRKESEWVPFFFFLVFGLCPSSLPETHTQPTFYPDSKSLHPLLHASLSPVIMDCRRETEVEGDEDCEFRSDLQSQQLIFSITAALGSRGNGEEASPHRVSTQSGSLKPVLLRNAACVRRHRVHSSVL